MNGFIHFALQLGGFHLCQMSLMRRGVFVHVWVCVCWKKMFNWSQISKCNLILKLIWHIFLILVFCFSLTLSRSSFWHLLIKMAHKRHSTIVDELCILFWQVYIFFMLFLFHYTVEWHGGWYEYDGAMAQELFQSPWRLSVCSYVIQFVHFNVKYISFHFISFNIVHIYFICCKQITYMLDIYFSKCKCWTGCFKWALKMQAAVNIFVLLYIIFNTIRQIIISKCLVDFCLFLNQLVCALHLMWTRDYEGKLYEVFVGGVATVRKCNFENP